MNNPTCPQCQHPAEARAAFLFMGSVTILLECDGGHKSVAVVPVGRFIAKTNVTR